MRARLAGPGDGDRQMVAILAAVPVDGLAAVEAACAEALAGGACSADVVLNILNRRRQPTAPAPIPTPDGLGFPPAGVDELANVCRPRTDGGTLDHKGTVEVVPSLERDGGPVARDLRWGVYVTFEAPSDYVRKCFAEYGLVTDESGRYAAVYKPYHLIGLDLGVSVASAALRREPTGAPAAGFCGDVVAVAKHDLEPGELLDGEGGYALWGKLLPAADSLALGGLPIGLAHDVGLRNAFAAGEPLRWTDVAIDESLEAVRVRREMEALETVT